MLMSYSQLHGEESVVQLASLIVPGLGNSAHHCYRFSCHALLRNPDSSLVDS